LSKTNSTGNDLAMCEVRPKTTPYEDTDIEYIYDNAIWLCSINKCANAL